MLGEFKEGDSNRLRCLQRERQNKKDYKEQKIFIEKRN